jgi:hypothetical protein
LKCRFESVITDQNVTSLPVPTVVGIAITGGLFLTLSSPS